MGDQYELITLSMNYTVSGLVPGMNVTVSSLVLYKSIKLKKVSTFSANLIQVYLLILKLLALTGQYISDKQATIFACHECSDVA